VVQIFTICETVDSDFRLRSIKQ